MSESRRDNTDIDVAPGRQEHALTYGSRYVAEPVPKYALPEESMPGNVAYQIVHDELNLDGNPALNLASFVTTWMEPNAERLMRETLNKNYIDQDEYPQTTEIQNRCVNMLARLFHASEEHASLGTATIGSSEAIHLAGLANDPSCDLRPEMTERVNYRASLALAEKAKAKGIKPLIFAASCSVYGAGEGELRETSPLNPVSLYAEVKIKTEQALNSMADNSFWPVHLRQATLFGLSPRMRFDLAVNTYTLINWTYIYAKKRFGLSEFDQFHPAPGLDQ